MKQISLTNEEYEILLTELRSLYGYHWRDDRIHGQDYGSKILPVIERNVKNFTDVSELLSKR